MSTPHETGYATLSEVLEFASSPVAAVQALEARYVEALSTDLGRALGRAIAGDERAGELVRLVEGVGEDDLLHRLCLPATARRLTTLLHGSDEVTGYLIDLLAGEAPAPEALPGFVCRVMGTVPVFTDPPDDEDLVAAVARVELELGRLDEVSPSATAYVRSVMRELHLVRDDSRPGFFSNSPQGFVGRAVITNPGLEMVDEVMLVEAVVHEATHGFVGMSEAIGLAGLDPAERWLLDDEPYDGESRVVSTWTGKALDIPTYLHACFVWWALLHLWSSVCGTGAFDERRVRVRIVKAAGGFRGNALVEELRPWAHLIQPELLRTLDQMGRRVDTLLAETGLVQLLGQSQP